MSEQPGPFETIYASLNLKQKEAVDKIDGPVMVIAGPGTGKTQILAARIAKILLETDSQSDNILCLTFTDAGAVAMRKRLILFIGAEAYKVHIHTFHSFCNLVIQENKDFFDHLDLSAASELEKHESVKYILDHLSIVDPLKRNKGLIYLDNSSLLQLFQLMKREHFSKDELLGRIDAFILHMYESPEFRYKRKSGLNNVGDLKENDIELNKKKLDRLKSAVSLLDPYNSRLREIQRYDFDDMILWVLNLFEKTPSVLSRYQEKFLYVLGDEFQDTNMSQNQIMKFLTSYWEAPNVFLVGDDDQAIYRFQGADISNILQFQNKYKKHIHNVLLTENYRSCQSILDGAGSVIENNDDRLVSQLPGLNKQLIASNPIYNKFLNKPSVVRFADSYSETVGIALQVEKLIEEGVEPKEIAIIYRKHKQVELIIKYLSNKKIPYNLVRRSNVLEAVIIIKLITLLEYVESEVTSTFSGQHLLFKILHFEEFEISALTIALLSKHFYVNKLNWREGLKMITSEPPDFLQNAIEIDHIKRAFNKLEAWIKDSQNLTVPLLVETIISKGGFLALAIATADKYETLETLKTFFSFIKEEAERRKPLTLREMMETLTEMQEYYIPLPLEYYFSHENGINLMTAHGSKGLEFEHVFIIDCNRDDWEKDTERSNFSLSLIFPKMNADTIIQDNRRLFYVALTRAKKHLQVSYHEQNEKGKAKSPARYVIELENSGSATTTIGTVPNEDRLQFMLSQTQAEQFPTISLIDKNVLTEILSSYSLSVTHLNTYLKCPLSFYFNHVLKVPSAKNEHMGFGSVVHSTLEFLIKKKNEMGSFPNTNELLQAFEYNMTRQNASFTPASFRRLLEYGTEILPKYYLRWIDDWKKHTDVLPEKRIINAVVDQIPINGILDKIIIERNQVNVVDYKTGKYSNARNKLKPPDPEKVPATLESLNGGDYWRQIMFYRILLDNDNTQSWNMTHGEIDFVEPEDDNFYKIEILIIEQHLAIVKEQIRQTYADIINLKFDIGCGDDNCQWCNFVRQNEAKFGDSNKIQWQQLN